MMSNNNNNKIIDESDILQSNSLIKFDEVTGLPSKKDSSKYLRENEVCAVILEFIVADFRVSSRQIARQTGINERTVNKYRKSDYFLKLLSEYTNKKMVTVRALAIDELSKLISDTSISPNVKAKLIDVALRHSEEISKIAMQKGKEVPVSVQDIMKELENF